MGAGDVISGVSPMLNSIPYVGGILSAAGSIAGGLMQKSEAQKQAAQAEKIRKDALNAKTQALRPEFLAKKRMDNMAYLSGLPGYGLAKENIDEQAATNLRAIRENSPTGAATVSAISSALQLGNKANRELDINNAEYRAKKLSDVGNTEWAIGEKQRQLEDIRDQTKREGLTAASAMENAATYNKLNSVNTITSALSASAASIGKAAQNQEYMKLLANASANGGLKSNPTTATTQNGTTTDGYYQTPSVTGGNYLGKTGDQLSHGEMQDVNNQYQSLLLKATNGELTSEEQANLLLLRKLMGEYSNQSDDSSIIGNNSSVPLAEQSMLSPK